MNAVKGLKPKFTLKIKHEKLKVGLKSNSNSKAANSGNNQRKQKLVSSINWSLFQAFFNFKSCNQAATMAPVRTTGAIVASTAAISISMAIFSYFLFFKKTNSTLHCNKKKKPRNGVVDAIGNTPLIRINSLSEATGCEVTFMSLFLFSNLITGFSIIYLLELKASFFFFFFPFWILLMFSLEVTVFGWFWDLGLSCFLLLINGFYGLDFLKMKENDHLNCLLVWFCFRFWASVSSWILEEVWKIGLLWK